MINFTAFASSSNGNLYTVDDGNTKVLLEMGLPISRIRQILGPGLSEISFALLSHCHADHSRAVADIMRAGIDVYASASTFDAMGIKGHRANPIKALKQFRVGSWTVLPVDVHHDAPDPFAFLMANPMGEKLLFATDTPYLKYRFRGLSVIAIECNHSQEILRRNADQGLITYEHKRRVWRNHFSLEQVKKFLLANDLSAVQEIHLIHLSDDNSDEALFKKEIQRLTGKPVRVAKA